MKFTKRILLMFALLTAPLASQAEMRSGSHRFSLSGGLVHLNNPSQTSFAIGAEYEYRLAELYGVGGQASYVFSSQAITIISVPAFYLHPLLGDWYISAAPVFYFGSTITTRVGARFMTRIPLELGPLAVVPTVGVDVIKGGPNYLFGLAFGI